MSGFDAVALRSGCVGGGSGTSSESGRGGVRVGDDARRRCGGSGGIGGPFDGAGGGAGRLYTVTTAVATCSNDRAEGAVDAEGLRLRRGGSLGTPLRTAVRSAELDPADEAEELGFLVGLVLRTRRIEPADESELLLSTSMTRSCSSFCSACFKLCAIRVAWRDC